jgi:uncharacterized protein YndB with AHSA1/START domain
MEFKFKVNAKVMKPVAEVFDAVYNPKKLSGYFTTAGASAPLDPGTTVMWDFADFPGAFPVHVKEVQRDKLIAFEWPAEDGAYSTRVEMTFEALEPGATMVSISEGTWRETEEGLRASYGNCEGWMNMAACLKAYLEYGINLRKDFF